MPDRSHLARIHIAIKELGLDDTSYRAILRRRYQQDSAANLSNQEADDLLELFREKGWRPASSGQRNLIHLLWHQLERTSAINHPGDEALYAFIHHATGKSDLRRLTVHEASRLIEQLKRWQDRLETTGRKH